MLFPANQSGLGERLAVQIVQQGGEITDILLDGGRGALLLPQVGGVALDMGGGQNVAGWFHDGILL